MNILFSLRHSSRKSIDFYLAENLTDYILRNEKSIKEYTIHFLNDEGKTISTLSIESYLKLSNQKTKVL